MSTPGPGPGTWGDAAPVLAAGATHLWLCDLDALRDPALLADYLSLLDTDEARRLDRLVFARDRHRFLVSHALLRYLLSLYGGRQAASWQFLKGPHGKPELAPGQGARAPAFNLSHSGSLALLAVSEGAGLLGVDIECHRAMRNFQGLATRNFAPSEAARLPGLDGAELAGEFYDLWTLKEAFVKACGAGLSQSLADFWFSFDRPAGLLRFEALRALDPEPWHWAFWAYRLEGPYSAALARRAVSDTDTTHGQPRCFATVPGRTWEAVRADCVLQSSSRITAI
ncbi:MAG: 4'-phosphopantetheinyl transferase superfamily protein [Gammaproteobacteria bacterium]|nr:4'-phosphopantetheinyl transferase superfamily protein [Gammaproteobacteria bacterium]